MNNDCWWYIPRLESSQPKKNPTNHKAISTNASFAVETEDAHSDANKLDHLAHCERIEIIGEAIEDSSVYLYPFIIEYSIIGISVVYRQELSKFTY